MLYPFLFQHLLLLLLVFLLMLFHLLFFPFWMPLLFVLVLHTTSIWLKLLTSPTIRLVLEALISIPTITSPIAKAKTLLALVFFMYDILFSLKVNNKCYFCNAFVTYMYHCIFVLYYFRVSRCFWRYFVDVISSNYSYVIKYSSYKKQLVQLSIYLHLICPKYVNNIAIIAFIKSWNKHFWIKFIVKIVCNSA